MPIIIIIINLFLAVRGEGMGQLSTVQNSNEFQTFGERNAKNKWMIDRVIDLCALSRGFCGVNF